MRILCACVVALVLSSSSALAAPILIYKDVERVTTLASVTGVDGVTHTESAYASGSILSDPAVSSIGTSSSIYDDTGTWTGQGPLIAGTNATIWESPGALEVSISGYACGDADWVASPCFSTGSAAIDMTFRPTDQHTLRVSPYQTSGMLDFALMDLTSRTIVQQASLPYGADLFFDFSNHHLYRLVASSSTYAYGGDPYGDFALSFFDRVTGEAADFAPAPVPEPTTMTLMGTGVVGLCVRRWRQGRKRERV